MTKRELADRIFAELSRPDAIPLMGKQVAMRLGIPYDLPFERALRLLRKEDQIVYASQMWHARKKS